MIKTSEKNKNWHIVDVNGETLGRIAVEIAALLMGKNKPEFERFKDIGDNVVVVNASKIKVTGKKSKNKLYYHHSGFPNGLRTATFEEIQTKNPSQIIFHAVKGMLPKNKLEDKMMKRLFVFSDEKHTFSDKF